MTKLNYSKRNLESKVARRKDESVNRTKPKKITAKQIKLMKDLGIPTNKQMLRQTASIKIKEALANKKTDR